VRDSTSRALLRLAAVTIILSTLAGGCGLDRLLGKKHEHRERARTGQHHRRHGEKQSGEAPPSTAIPGPAAEPGTPGAPSVSVHLALGAPEGPRSAEDYLIVRPQYALAYSQKRNGPSWVSWELNAGYFGGEPRHQGKFITDTSLPAGFYRVTHDDYTGSGYDRGHMVRSEERTRSREDNEATFLLTNILPQRHDLNAGPWLRLEDYCQTLAKREKRELYLAAGGIYGDHPETIGHGVAVPEAFYKIVVVLDRGQGARDVTRDTRVIAVIMPNKTGILDDAWGKYRASVGEIERRSGYHFLSRVDEGVRRAIEARVDSGPTG
jgi:endonuclease G